jgi:hypothetical protein
MASKTRGKGPAYDRESRTIWGHSLPAAAVCLGAAATIVLVAIFGRPG